MEIQEFFCNLKQVADLALPENTLCQPRDLEEAKCFVAKLKGSLQEEAEED